MNGIAMMLKSLGIDPQKIEQQAKDFVQSFEKKIEELDAKIVVLEHNKEIMWAKIAALEEQLSVIEGRTGRDG